MDTRNENPFRGCLIGGLAGSLLWAAGIAVAVRSCSSDTPEPEHGPAVGVVAPAEGGSSPHRVQPSRVSDDPLRPLFSALATVESGGDDAAVGDGGKSIGRYQIGRLYWMDAKVPGRYEDVLDPAYAERVMLAYWSRWCPEALANRDYEVLSRVHNGGPRGAKKSATLPYWKKVEKALTEGAK